MVQNVQYSNGPPSHVTLPFECRTPILSCIQVFGIQMVTVVTGHFFDFMLKTSWYSSSVIKCLTGRIQITELARYHYFFVVNDKRRTDLGMLEVLFNHRVHYMNTQNSSYSDLACSFPHSNPRLDRLFPQARFY